MLLARYGSAFLVINAFLFIGLDFTLRDRLHETWKYRGLWWKMAALVALGSFLTYLFSPAAKNIALASAASFLAAGLVDSIAYHALRDRAQILKVNGSNILGSATDSILFPALAYGLFLPGATLGMFAAKILGGFFWFIILRRSVLNGTFRTKNSHHSRNS